MIARTLLVQTGIEIDEATVRKYMPRRPRGRRGGQTWRTFMHNHARAILACDFAVSYVPSLFGKFHIYYVLVVMEIGSRRIVHTGVTASDRSVDREPAPHCSG